MTNECTEETNMICLQHVLLFVLLHFIVKIQPRNWLRYGNLKLTSLYVKTAFLHFSQATHMVTKQSRQHRQWLCSKSQWLLCNPYMSCRNCFVTMCVAWVIAQYYIVQGDLGYYRQVCSLRHGGFCRPNYLKLGHIIQLDWEGLETNSGFSRFQKQPHDEENKIAENW